MLVVGLVNFKNWPVMSLGSFSCRQLPLKTHFPLTDWCNGLGGCFAHISLSLCQRGAVGGRSEVLPVMLSLARPWHLQNRIPTYCPDPLKALDSPLLLFSLPNPSYTRFISFP